MSMIPINNSNRSPLELRAGIPPGLPQQKTELAHHNLQNIMWIGVSDSS